MTATPELTVSSVPLSVCERCGSFASELMPWRGKSLCESCITRGRDEARKVRLYPPQYIWVLALLCSGALAAVLAAMNWKRVGDESRARFAWMVSALWCVGLVIVILLPRAPSGLLIVGAFVTTRQVLHGWKPFYEEHRRIGGARANLILPVLIGFAALVGLVLALMGLGIIDAE